MEDYKQRIQQEKNELDARIVKLYDFLKSEKVSELNGHNRSLLNKQFDSMLEYSNILNSRLLL